MMKLKKGFAVAMAAGVLTTGGLGVQASVFSATAFAQSVAGRSEYDAAVTKIPDVTKSDTPPAKATLYIHKLAQQGQDSPTNNGTKQDVKGNPVQAVFDIYKITKTGNPALDMSMNEGQKEIAKLAAEFKKADTSDAEKAKAFFTGKGYTVATNPDEVDTSNNSGLAEKELDKGVYLVVEKSAAKGLDANGQAVDFDASVKPFVVALPITDPATRTGWLNQLHVYPKNQKSEESKKEAVSADSFLGDQVKEVEVDSNQVKQNHINYKISQTLTAGEPYDGVVIADYYDSSQLKLVKSTSTTNPTPQVKLDGTALESEDYTLEEPTGQATGSTKKMVTFKLTTEGLAKVNAADKVKADRTLTVELQFEAAKVTEAAKTKIENKAKTWTHRGNSNNPVPPTTDDIPGDPDNPPTDGPHTDTYYGQVNIQKLKLKGDSDTETENLEGAEFDLYTCDANATIVPANKLNKTPIVTLKDKDTPEISGLLVNDYDINGKKVTDYSNSFYCLKEVKSPDGFELLAEPIKFQVLKGDTAEVPVKTTDAVIDSKGNGGFELPLTGGKGVFALLLAGAAFLVLGRGYSVYAGRRKDA